MEATTRLREVLEALGQGALEDDNEAGVDQIPVKFTEDTPCADVKGRWVKVNPDVRDTYGRTLDGTTELRVIADTLYHEVEHVNVSDLMSKSDVAEANPDMPRAAGMVANILEDRYIDERRMTRSPGQRVSHRVKIEAIMGNHHRRPKLSTLLDKEGMMPALVECALQVTAAGYGKGLEDLDADHDLVEFAARWAWVADEAEDADDLDHRLDVIQSGVDLLREYAPDGTTGQDADDAAEERGGGNLFDDDEAPDLDDLDMDPDDVERGGDIGDGPDGPTPDFDPDDLDDFDPDDLDDPAGPEGEPMPPEPDDFDPEGGDGVEDMVDDLIDENDGVEEADPEEMPDPDDTPGPEPEPGPEGEPAPEPDDGEEPGGEGGAGGEGEADGDTDTADDGEAGDTDGTDNPAADDGDGDGDTDTDADTARVEALLDEYAPDDLEVVR